MKGTQSGSSKKNVDAALDATRLFKIRQRILTHKHGVTKKYVWQKTVKARARRGAFKSYIFLHSSQSLLNR